MAKRKRQQRKSAPEESSLGQGEEECSDSPADLHSQDSEPARAEGSYRRNLEPGKGLVFEGCSKLTVLQGNLKVMGKIVSAGSKSVSLSTLGLDGAGIVLTALEGCSAFPLVDMQHKCTFELSENSVKPHMCPLFSKRSPPCYLFPDLWESEAAKVSRLAQYSSPVVVLILGDQGSGKSSYFRFMINSLLNQSPAVGALELDVGQPEFETPGQMSLALVDEPLLGGPVTHKVKARESVFYGAPAPSKDPTRYLNSVRDLFGKWSCVCSSVNEGKVVPLVVNTCGWTTGLGEVILLEIVKALRPSHIFHLKGSNPAKMKKTSLIQKTQEMSSKMGIVGFVRFLPSMMKGNIHYYLSHLSKQEKMQYKVPQKVSRNRRVLLFLKWAGQCIGQDTSTWKWGKKGTMRMVAGKLAALRPWKVDLKDIIVECLFGRIEDNDILQILNGALVGMSTTGGSDRSKGTNSNVRKCLGMGLVRSIDPASRSIFILTDVEACILTKVDLIQVGAMRAPPELCMTNQYHSPFLVPKGLVNEVF